MAVSQHCKGCPTPDAVELFVRGHARKLGLPEGVTPHTLRHCFACHSLEDGISHTFIQQLMGIRSPFDTFEKAGMEAGIDGR